MTVMMTPGRVWQEPGLSVPRGGDHCEWGAEEARGDQRHPLTQIPRLLGDNQVPECHNTGDNLT